MGGAWVVPGDDCGDLAAEICQAIGLRLTGAQLAVLWLAFRCEPPEPGGRRARMTLAEVSADEATAAAVCVAGLLLFGERQLWTASRPELLASGVGRVRAAVTGSAGIGARFGVRSAAGDQEARLPSGGRLLFRAPSRCRGFAADRLVVSGRLSGEQLGCVMPCVRAGSQVIYVSD